MQQSKHERALSKFSITKAHDAQLRMSERIVRRDTGPSRMNCVAGVDVAYTEKLSIGACAAVNYDTLTPIELKTASAETMFPYVPTLLSFREVPPAVAAIRTLTSHPDVFLVDGQGIMHPYGCGFASHLGLILDAPTIGVAKNPLSGEIGVFNEENWAPVTDGQRIVGAALTTRTHGVSEPVYVSVGHMISLNTAIKIVKHCTPKHRIPEPIRLAHSLATREKRKLQSIDGTKKATGEKL